MQAQLYLHRKPSQRPQTLQADSSCQTAHPRADNSACRRPQVIRRSRLDLPVGMRLCVSRPCLCRRGDRHQAIPCTLPDPNRTSPTHSNSAVKTPNPPAKHCLTRTNTAPNRPEEKDPSSPADSKTAPLHPSPTKTRHKTPPDYTTPTNRSIPDQTTGVKAGPFPAVTY